MIRYSSVYFMKTLTYSIQINKPREFVFSKIADKSVYPEWAKVWGEGMTFEGEYTEGEHVSFLTPPVKGPRWLSTN